MRINILKYAPIIEKARTSFWFLPSFMVLSSIVLAVFSVYIDAIFIDSVQLSTPLIYSMDISSTRSLLGTIAGAMITVTSIAFSMTIVALTLASSQFGPRLLRNFMMDKGTQVVLGFFISNFLFCILVFCALSFQEPYAFKPGLTVVIALLMTCCSVGVLIYFIHHVSKSIQADVVINDVYQELQKSIANLFPLTKEESEQVNKSDDKETDLKGKLAPVEVLAHCSGYIQTTDHKLLLALAIEKSILIECKFIPGNFVVKNSVIALIHSDQAVDESVVNHVANKIVLGSYRTPVQDPEFAIHQLVEVALRALSPGINDPYTAITCVDKLNSVLCELTSRTFPENLRYDKDDVLRLVCKVLSFTDIAKAAFEKIRQHASNDIAVTIRLLESLNNLMLFAKNDAQKQFVISQTKMIEAHQSSQAIAEGDLKEINDKIALIFQNLDK